MYREFGSIHCAESQDIGLFFWARLLDAEGHPVLGHAPDIRTSRLVTLPDAEGTFETLNTIYKRKQ